ncbi:outer membrane protein transport protein [Acinetobacter sp. ANC 4945]|uniref:Transporter n=1 Tax=Acinetobacter amyesii TaxID=2942470 RepID=A0A1T1GUL2_9GAMM|nr:outer membrane protein transport protein [Acinetobacter amyesii]MCL6247908.1 outer membrane protein transport protein [Acinetobacter amyesii]OOV81127.1 transporter [Acinetobacter amyesii]
MKKITIIAALSCIYTVPLHAAGLDRSGQSILAFLQPNNYFEAGISVLDASLSGTMNDNFNKGGLSSAANMHTGDIANSYYSPSAALKFQLTDHFSLGFLYDHPFGADAGYPIKEFQAYTEGTEKSESEVVSQNLSTIVGYQPNENWNFYAGPALQTVKGKSRLRGAGYSWSRYDLDAPETTGVGWLAGAAYMVPDIALKASITYRSEINHDMDMTESLNILHPVYGRIDLGTSTEKSNISTPQSINVDLQTGIMKDTVAFANIRWVDWSEFKISPKMLYQFTEQSTGAGVHLAAYYDDQISANIGIGRKLNEKLSGTFSVGWDSGAGDLVSTLGPSKGYWNVGLGAQFSPAKNYFISGGVKYFWLGDAKAQSGFDFGTEKYDAVYQDNHAVGYGLKIGYRF